MFIDGYGVFAACRKIACLAILLAFSSSVQAGLPEPPQIRVTFESTQRSFTSSAEEDVNVVGKITITDGSTQTRWSIGKGEPNYGRADFILSIDNPNPIAVTPTTMGKTVVFRYKLLEDPAIDGSIDVDETDKFDVIAQDGTRRSTLTLIVGIINNPPRIYDSEREEITSPASVGTYTSTFIVGGVSTTVFTANEVEGNTFSTWSIIPNVDSLATVSFANTVDSQFIGSLQDSEVEVVYRSIPDENVADAGYTLVVRDRLGRAATVTVLLTPEFPVIRHEGSPAEDGELAVNIGELDSGNQVVLSAEYPCPSEVPECLSWSGDDVDITPSPTAGGDTVTVTVPVGTGEGFSFTVKVEALDATRNLASETTVNVTIVANKPPKIVSIDGQTARRTFSVSPNLETVRFYVVATDDFDPESMTWEISNAEGSEKGTASFVVMDGMMESTATTARGSKVRVDFRKGTASSSFTLTVMDRAGGSAETTVTVNPNPPGSPFSPTGVEWNTDVFVEGAASSLALTFRAISAGLGETDVLRWSVFDLDGLVVGTASSVTTGPEGKFVLNFANPSTQITGTFRVQVVGSYGNTGVYSRKIMVSVRNKPPVVAYQVDDVSGILMGAGGTICLQEGKMTTAISFSADVPVGQPPAPAGSTFMWELGEQHGLRVSFVGTDGKKLAAGITDKGENVVVRFEEPPVEGSYFVILVTFRGGTNTLRVITQAKEVRQLLRIRTFLGGAVR